MQKTPWVWGREVLSGAGHPDGKVWLEHEGGLLMALAGSSKHADIIMVLIACVSVRDTDMHESGICAGAPSGTVEPVVISQR